MSSPGKRRRPPVERTQAYREHNRLTRRQLYAANKAQGLCAHCGERPPYEGLVSCLPCRAKFREYARHYTYRQRERKRQGLPLMRATMVLPCQCGAPSLIACVSCEAPLCDTCYDIGEGWCRTCGSVRAS